jgi:hypothetical protein
MQAIKVEVSSNTEKRMLRLLIYSSIPSSPFILDLLSLTYQLVSYSKKVMSGLTTR